MNIITPVSDDDIDKIKVGCFLEISGYILCGRDAVLPKIVESINNGYINNTGIELRGQVIFHTAVSPAGVGPTSSNKKDIESSIIPLAQAGVKIHLGKGKLHKQTEDVLAKYNSIYAIIPPVTALLKCKTIETSMIAFPELGMEALYRLKVEKYPAIVACAHGESIYDRI